MKALVTGANGFTGSHLTKHLLEKGYRVRILVRQNSNLDRLSDLSVECFHADLAHGPLPENLMDDVDIVFHIAAAYRAENVPKRYFWNVNVEGTRRLLNAAKEAKIKRFVHCSTAGVQGEIKNPPAKEEDPYNPGDYYQESKVEGEKLALDYLKNYGLPITIVRPVGIYGPGDFRFLKLFRSINGGKFFMIGSGKVLYHLTYVEDLVRGIVLAAQKREALGEIFTIGGSEYVTLNELVGKISAILNKSIPNIRIPAYPVRFISFLFEMICKPVGITPPLYRRRVDFFIKDRAFDISKAKMRLGYNPKVSLDEGLRITADWYSKNKLI